MKNNRNIIVFVLHFCLCLVNAQNFYNYNQCITPDNRLGFCIDLQQCNSLLALVNRVPLTSSHRFYLSRSQCGYYNDSPWVCCPPEIPQTNSRPIQPPIQPPFQPPIQPPIQPNFQSPIQPNIQSPIQPTIQQPTPPGPTFNISDLPPPGTCGKELSDRLYGGKITRIQEFPWMALLQYTKPNNEKDFNCGGVLINENYVLTASHCVNGREILNLEWKVTAVRLGEWDIDLDQDCEETLCSDPVQDIPVAQTIPHEEYQPYSRVQVNDIALLRLSRSVRFSNWVKPICLPVAPHLQGRNYDGVTLDVAGWGKTETESFSNVKRKLELDGVPLSQCNDVYRAQNVVLRPSQLCAGGEQGRDSCSGDSGGPLTALDTSNRNNYYYLVGVVSFGPTICGTKGWPGVYTRADSHIDWILSNMRP